MTTAANLDPPDDKAAAPKALAPLDMLGFAVRASRQHFRLGLLVAVGTIALGLAVSKMYLRSTRRLLRS